MTSRLPVLALALALAAAGCGDKKPPPRPAARPAPAPVAAAPDSAAEKPAAPEWSYSSVGKRDPFRSFLAELETTAQAAASRCPTPLGRFELDQLKLAAVVTGLDDPVAMVQAPNGVGYTVRRGACIGKNGGVVAAVRSGEVVVSEWAIRADGTRDRTQTILRLPKQASLNVEE
ncbi:MAG TPA: pilus assembly protein PilP [Anaeromyxobacteraceae bacterium]|nr:pilus assembly protein PilP [Anaeromyxobacteraceae bacterium]